MAKILVIDDERSIRNTLKEILEFEQHKVELAEDGKKGLDMAKGMSYDIIFSDIKMPEIDGMDLLQALINDAGVFFSPMPTTSISDSRNLAASRVKSLSEDTMQNPCSLPAWSKSMASIISAESVAFFPRVFANC